MSKKYGLSNSSGGAWRKNSLMLGIALPFLLVLVFSQTATQYLAYRAGYHADLGSPLLPLPWLSIYKPWEFIAWRVFFTAALYYEALKTALVASTLLLLPALALAAKSKQKGILDLHGSARWATLPEVQSMGLLDGAGVYIGGFKNGGKTHYLRHDGPEHIMGFAPTRSGKGVGPILSTLLSWPASLLCLDIKGENWALSSGFRKNVLCQKLLRFDPADDTGTGARFNPLQEIRIDTHKAIQDIQNIATMIIDPDGKGLDSYWAEAGFAFMSGAVAHAVVTQTKHGQCASLTDLALALAGEEISEFLNAMLETDHAAILKELYPNTTEQHGFEVHQFIASAGRDMLNKSDNERSGVLGTTLSKLPLYRDPVVAKNISVSDFNINDIMNGEKPISLYLVVSPADIDRMKPLMRLIVSLIMTRRTEKMDFADGRSVAGYKHRLLMLLDEFTSLGKLRSIEQAISFCAGYGIKLMIIIQDIVQLNAAYTKDSAIMGNCHIRFAFATNNPETAKYLSEMTGKATIVRQTESISGSGRKKSKSTSVQEVSRALLTPDEIARLPGMSKGFVLLKLFKRKIKPGDMLIFTAGQYPIYGKQILYFQDPVFLQRAKITAPAISDRLDKEPLEVEAKAQIQVVEPRASPDSENEKNESNEKADKEKTKQIYELFK